MSDIHKIEAEILLLFDEDVWTENEIGYWIDKPSDPIVKEALYHLLEKDLIIKEGEYYNLPEDVQCEIYEIMRRAVEESYLLQHGRK